MPRLVEARCLRDFVIWVRFNDGTEGAVDLAGELPNGADLAPEFLRERVRIPA